MKSINGNYEAVKSILRHTKNHVRDKLTYPITNKRTK